ncbi:MAG: glycerate kinase [Betaproteobacteria bacterium]|uniref:glycerate kinase type-2 family protein n=1 Tax=Ferrovum sp. PN-J185 TaxID=1356306 RepID=UPI000834B05D|nr:glycerate kinase [Betaproteobacteria bacterium]MDE2055800.1 glycerate kinase [Betaproteobacteria bacterium]
MQQAINAADPKLSLPHYLPPVPKGRTIVVGAGKAAASMAQAFEENWQAPLTGLVVTRYGHKVPTRFIEVVEARHPVPDEAGLHAAQRILSLVNNLTADDLVVCLISGGGSALLTAPAPGLTLHDKQTINQALLKSGATIDEMNCVRKHLSSIKGGQLALSCAPARVWTLLISDVPGDDPSVIASGPTVADPTTFSDALAIVEKYRITEPQAAIHYLRSATKETPKPGDSRLETNEVHMIATPQMSLEAAAQFARSQGITPMILGDALEGEARDVALVHAGITKQVLRHGQPINRPCLLLSGGETTVTVRGTGRGGRNTEFLLALSVALAGLDNVYALACDTDGVDGTEDNAGAVITPDTLSRADHLGLSAKSYLANNDGYTFFERLGDLVITGPTLTNVNDFRAILIL